MKLALIRRQFTLVGGAELYVQRLITALAESGHELHVFAERWDQPKGGITHHPVPITTSRAQRPLAFAQGVEEALAKATRSWRFDCIISFDRTLRQDVYRAGDGVHQVWLERRRQFSPWWKRPFIGISSFHRNMCRLERMTFDPARTGRIIVNSNMVGREIRSHFHFPADRMHLVRNGIVVDRFQSGKREETRAKLGLKPNDFTLLFVGSGWERKGLAYVIKAVDRIAVQQGLDILNQEWSGDTTQRRTPDRLATKLVVVGKGRVRNLMSKDFIFTGPMSDVENAYAAADLFVFPPIYEPSANAVFEALAAGLPVITSAFNGASELIQEGVNGSVLKDPSDIDALVHAIRFWASQRFLNRVQDTSGFQLETNVKATLNIIQRAVEDRAAQAQTPPHAQHSLGGLPQ